LSLFTFQLHSDLDKGNSMVKYTLSGEGVGSIFTIEPSTGDIHALRSLDREEKPYYTLRAQAVDVLTGRPLEPESEFIIKVQDINDNEPRFLEGPYSASVPEMSPIGSYVTQITATDADDPTYGNSARIVYSILHGQPYFSVDPKTGERLNTWSFAFCRIQHISLPKAFLLLCLWHFIHLTSCHHLLIKKKSSSERETIGID
ncbi:hypothetical protein cypCar_00037891, partial [Cyprinus carpio]